MSNISLAKTGLNKNRLTLAEIDKRWLQAGQNCLDRVWKKGSLEKGSLEKGSFQTSPFLGILENLEIWVILENPKTVENKEQSDHFLETPENPEIFEIPPVRRPLS